MKKIVSFMIVLFFVIGTCFPQVASDDVKKAQMSHFMKVKWGVSLKDFKKSFKERVGLKTKLFGRAETQEQEGSIPMTIRMLKNYLVIDFNVDIFFVFKCPLEKIRELKSKYSEDSRTLELEYLNPKNLFFHSVMLEAKPEYFNDLYAIFKEKYGAPTIAKESKITSRMGAEFKQIEATWINERINRKLVMKRYGNMVDKCYVEFSPYEKDYMAKRMKYIKEAAAIF